MKRVLSTSWKKVSDVPATVAIRESIRDLMSRTSSVASARRRVTSPRVSIWS